MLKVILTMMAGGLGALARFYVESQFTKTACGFPWNLFVINCLGCFLFGLLVETLKKLGRKLEIVFTDPFCDILGIGFLGGFTTFSSYVAATFLLGIKDCFFIAAVFYVLTAVCGFLSVLIAQILIEAFFPHLNNHPPRYLVRKSRNKPK